MGFLSALTACKIDEVQLRVDNFIAGLDSRARFDINSEDAVGPRRRGI